MHSYIRGSLSKSKETADVNICCYHDHTLQGYEMREGQGLRRLAAENILLQGCIREDPPEDEA